MNVCDTSYHNDTLTSKTKYDYVKGQKSLGLNTKPCHKPYNLTLMVCQWLTELQVGHEDMTKAYKFDLEVKGQHRIGIMNVRDTSSYGDTLMCQIW